MGAKRDGGKEKGHFFLGFFRLGLVGIKGI